MNERCIYSTATAIPQVHYVATYCFRKQKIETVGDYPGGALRAPP